MKILQVNKFGSPGSGAENYFLRLIRHLIERGHEVAALCMRPEGVPSEVLTFEVPHVDFHKQKSVSSRLEAVATVWKGPRAAKAITAALAEFEPDVVHFHNIAHQLSHAVVEISRKHRIPSVMTCHDYKLICPSYLGLRDGRPCFRCASGSTFNCLAFKCLNDSYSWSGLAAAEAARTRLLAPNTLPQLLLCPSEFMRSKLSGSWLQAEDVRIVSAPNPVDPPRMNATRTKAHGAIYVGRLSPEKGVDLAVRASLRAGVPLTIVGDGSQRTTLESLASDLSAPVTFLGFKSGKELDEIWSTAAFQVAPSICAENAPLSIIEGLVRGVPFVGSDIGGLPELARFGGAELVAPGDTESLADGMRRASQGLLPQLNIDGVRSHHDWSSHLVLLEQQYDRVKAL